MEQALAKLEKYPLEERVHFEKLCREELADIYLYADDPRAAGQIGRCIDLHRAWVAALVPRRGRSTKERGTRSDGAGSPSPFTPPPGPLSDFFHGRFTISPYTIFCRPLGMKWKIN